MKETQRLPVRHTGASVRTLRVTLILTALLMLWGCYAFAQTALPYYTGFDNAAERSGWTQARMGSTAYPRWEIGMSNSTSPSAPNVLGHDYPVGNPGGDTVEDWMLSPSFNFPNGGMVQSLKVSIFAIIGRPTASDELGIYLLKSTGPNSVTMVAKLADLTRFAAASNNWHDTGGFVIPPTTGTCYIGIKYRAAENWFVPELDNIRITGNAGTGILSAGNGSQGIRLFPNPAGNTLYLTLGGGPATATVALISLTGQIVARQAIAAGTTSLDVAALPAGTYLVQEAFSDGSTATDKLIIAR